MFALLSFQLVGCGDGGATLSRIQGHRIANIGTVPFEPPLIYQKGEELAGPDVELARLIVSRIQDSPDSADQDETRIVWAHRTYSTLVPSLLKGEFDFIVGVFAITEDRKEEIIFSDPYYTSQLVLIVNPVQKDINRSSLGGARIGVRQGTGVEEFVNQEFSSSTVTPFKTLDDAVLALRRSEVDTVVDDQLMAAYSLAMIPGAGHLEIVPEVLGTLECAVGLKWRDTGLQKLVNDVIAEMNQTGLFTTWVEEHAGNCLEEVLARREVRLEKARTAGDPRQITIRVSKSRDLNLDIYRMANLRFALTETGSGESHRSSRIQFEGSEAVARVSVPPGSYKLALQEFSFSTMIEVSTDDPLQVPIFINLTPRGAEVSKGER
jgi:ABC-type amino acid transport substrate-binding protein